MEMVKEATKMFAEGAGGVVLGSACDSFLKSIGKCCMFDYPVLESVKSTVENLRAVTPEMEDLNNKLGDRQDEVKELREELERGKSLLDEMSEVGYWSLYKASYNDQLVGLDASLKSLVGKLHLQSALVVKEVLVSTKETGRVVKRTKRKVDEVDENVKDILNIMKKQEQKDLANKVGLAIEGAGLVAGLEEIADLTCPAFLSDIRLDFAEMFRWLEEMHRRARRTIGLIETKTAASEVTLYFRVGELRDFRMLIEEGVNDIRKYPTILEWTDDLKSQYTSKFRDLNKTLEALYNRLAGMRPFRWRCGNCDESLAKASTSIGGSAGFAIQGN
ncbi:uncharacterized protein LOC126798213 [Argentina anserina]|uniref:uncharacterized protein LOC126798213 n=1 Tax=Argentina anserina TaxID=57926 RepID=UPI0021762756|nr:uncharacterized protein LOC126798213 [Potentilla anserina]